MGIPCETLPTNCTGIYLIKNLVNNKIYIGDYERYRLDNSKETEVFMNDAPDIITRE